MPGRRDKWSNRDHDAPSIYYNQDYQLRAESFREYAREMPLRVPPLTIDPETAYQKNQSQVKEKEKKEQKNDPIKPKDVLQTLISPSSALTGTVVPSVAAAPESSSRLSHETYELPKLQLLDTLDLNENHSLLLDATREPYSPTTLCAAIQENYSIDAIERYLQSYDRAIIRQEIDAIVEGRCTALFYAIERNDVSVVKLLLQYGANADAEFFSDTMEEPVPALAFAIIRGKQLLHSPLEVIKTMLAYGADPRDIPFTTEMNMPTWKSEVVAAMNLSQGYFMQRAKVLPPPGQRTKQIADSHGMMEFLRIPYHLIGQSYATTLVKENVFSHVAMDSREPLVMAFAGPSGHGKTEMACQMGKLLSVDTTVIDCAQMKHDTDLFGSRNGYQRSQEGSQLNNFLAEHDGERSVVFLDEFDKTSKEVRHALLLVCDSGYYHDRRNNTRIDCSKTLWILATNLGDKKILKFFTENLERKPDNKRGKVSISPLQDEIRGLFTTKFGAPFTGRINLVVPFFPFTMTERCVVAHKFLLDLAEDVRQPIELRSEVKHFVGHCHLDISDGAEIAKHIANTFYNPDLGARSLRHAVNNIKRKLVMAYCNAEDDEQINEETNNGPFLRFMVQLHPLSNESSEITVIRDGSTQIFKSVQKKEEPKLGSDVGDLGDSLIEVDTDDNSSSEDSDEVVYRVKGPNGEKANFPAWI